MPRLRVLGLATTLAVPGSAAADIAIKVPRNLLGGRVAPGNPLPPAADPTAAVDPADPVDPDFTDGVDGIDLLAPNFWNLVWPDDAGPVADPASFTGDCDEDVNPGSCGLWGDDAAQLVPLDDVIPTVDPAEAPPTTLGVAARLRPGLGTWMGDQTPTLRWTPQPGATHYNVQIYVGPRRVASAWTTGTHITVPPRVLNQGRTTCGPCGPASAPPSAASSTSRSAVPSSASCCAHASSSGRPRPGWRVRSARTSRGGYSPCTRRATSPAASPAAPASMGAAGSTSASHVPKPTSSPPDSSAPALARRADCFPDRPPADPSRPVPTVRRSLHPRRVGASVRGST